MSTYRPDNSGGYIALITGILISVSLLVLVAIVSFQGFFSRFTVFESEQKEQSSYLAESCVQTAILKIAQNVNYHQTATFPEPPVPVGGTGSTCTVASISQGTFPSLRDIKARGVVGNAVTNLIVTLDTSALPDVAIEAWQEVGSLGP